MQSDCKTMPTSAATPSLLYIIRYAHTATIALLEVMLSRFLPVLSPSKVSLWDKKPPINGFCRYKMSFF